MKKHYLEPILQLADDDSDVIVMSGDGFADDPWAEGFGGES